MREESLEDNETDGLRGENDSEGGSGGMGNVEQLQAPTSSVCSTRSTRPPTESPSKTHARTPNALKSPPKVRKSPPNTPGPSENRSNHPHLSANRAQNAPESKKLMIPMPQHPSQDARVRHGLLIPTPVTTPSRHNRDLRHHTITPEYPINKLRMSAAVFDISRLTHGLVPRTVDLRDQPLGPSMIDVQNCRAHSRTDGLRPRISGHFKVSSLTDGTLIHTGQRVNPS